MSAGEKKKVSISQLISAALSIILIAYGVYSLTMHATNTGQVTQDVGVKDNSGAYEKYYYYDDSRKLRYEAYGARKPGMDPSEVVWRVNSDLDIPFYSKVVTISDFTAPVLVNKYRKLPDDFVPKELVNTSSGQVMTPDTKVAYEALRDAASAEGYHINAISGYRSIEYQKGYYNKILMELGKEKTDRLVPRAGFSEQHLGVALELSAGGAVFESSGESPEAVWIAENAHLFGFIVRYTQDNQDVTGYDPNPGFVTYVGTEIAEDMRRYGIKSLEEYYVKYVNM